MSMKLKAPNGKDIQGTAENVGGVAGIMDLERDESGTVTYDHDGETEIYWDGQETLTRDGEVIFIDVGGDEWLESELIPVDAPPIPNAKTRAPTTVTRELTHSQLATVLAALRHYQQSGMTDVTRLSKELHDVATDDLRLTPLNHREINELCESLNFG